MFHQSPIIHLDPAKKAWHTERKVSVRMLAQKLIFIHNTEKQCRFPRWRTNVDWCVKIRKFNSLAYEDYPDTTIVNWKAGGTINVCWKKQVHVSRNEWFCHFLGINPESATWCDSDLEEFQSYYLEI